MFKMLIGSDLVPTSSNYELFAAGDISALADEKLISELRKADFRIFNLETPLCDIEKPIPKCGPNLIAPTSTLPGIKAFNPSLLALANNHILDHDNQGLFKTFEMLEKWEIPYMGAGNNLAEAQKPYIVEADGKKIGIYNCAEHEFTIAEENKPGANPFDLLDSPDHIAALKSECDFVIVLYHGGKEHYRYPSPYLQKVCRKIAEKGADLVVCQHSHCVGCMEEYNGSKIIYGQGNFLFNKNHGNEFWQTSILVCAEFTDSLNVDFIPIYMSDKGVCMAEGEAAKEILDGFESRSREITKPGVIYDRYKEYCFMNKQWYLYSISGGEKNLRISSADYVPQFSNDALLRMINYLHCEPHRELLSTLVTEMTKEQLGGEL